MTTNPQEPAVNHQEESDSGDLSTALYANNDIISTDQERASDATWSVNHFSQSVRVLSKSTGRPMPDVSHTSSKGSTSSGEHVGTRTKHLVSGKLESTTKIGRPLSDSASSSSSFMSRLRDSALEHAAIHDSSSILAPSLFLRSRTFSGFPSPKTLGSTSLSQISSSQRTSSSSRPIVRMYSSKSPLALRRPSRTRRIQRTSSSFTPDTTRPRSNPLQSPESTGSICRSARDDEVDTKMERDSNDVTIIPALDSCTAAMRTLSPPSVKTTSSSAPFLVTATRRLTSKESAKETTVSSLDVADTIWDNTLEDVSHGIRTKYHPSKPTTPEPFSDTMTSPKGLILRRHHTMISSPGEFMRSLELQGKRRATRFRSSIDRKSVVFSQDNYVPNPLREDCQMLPCAHFVSKPDDTTKRITPRTVVDVLEGKYKDYYDLLYIIDCRFPYEFEGGHIRSAVNINTIDRLEELLLQPAITDKRVLLIFHCEFSCERGPRMARHLRNQDRVANTEHYPAVFYPEVYVMEGGYSGFFKENRSYCSPEAYVKMQDEKHSKEFEEHRRIFGREFSKTASKSFLGTDTTESRHNGDVCSDSPLSLEIAPTSVHNNEENPTTTSKVATSPTMDSTFENTGSRTLTKDSTTTIASNVSHKPVTETQDNPKVSISSPPSSLLTPIHPSSRSSTIQ
ncbi:cell division cycle- protein [Mortierella sp. GBA43]|nr:cell division cycle- protein [Mortierella sp. GBA43]